MAKQKQFNLLDVATISGSRISGFDGSKQYVATADIDLNRIIGGEKVTYDNKPSRADLIMGQNDVLFAKMKNTVKVLAGSSEVKDKIFSTGFYILTPKEKISKKYLYFYLLSDHFNLQKDLYSSGATMMAIGNEGLKRIKISLPVDGKDNPDIKEQNRIADMLEEAERLKQKRVEVEQKMTELVPALFNKMFGDPMTNKLNWKIGVLGDVIYSAKDGPHVSPKYSDDSGIPMLSSRNVKPGRVIWKDIKYIDLQEAKKQWKKCKPEMGDVLYTKGGTTGVAAAVTFDRPIAVWVHVALLKTNQEKVNPLWLETILNTQYCYKQSQELTHGIANRDLGLGRMQTIKIFIPPIQLQDEFAEKMKSLQALTNKQKESRIFINSLFSSLLISLTK